LKFLLGKKEYRSDPRTLSLLRYVLSDVRAPSRFDFDRHRWAFPLRPWGNEIWQDCVIAAHANQLLRFGRLGQNMTLRLSDKDVVEQYKRLSGAKLPGDKRDKGLVVLDSLRDWQQQGWPLPLKKAVNNFKIAAYGEIEPNDPKQLRLACYVLHGVQIGFSLPLAAQRMSRDGLWDYRGETGREWKPGGWGGQLTYAKAYNERGVELLSWGRALWASNRFIEHYADEAWGIVNSLEDWRSQQSLDVELLAQHVWRATGEISKGGDKGN